MRFFTLILLFCLSQPTFSQLPFYPTENAGGSNFGRSVAVSGSEILVASNTSTMPPTSAGKVFMFEKSGNNIVQTATFLPANVTPTDQFGASLSIDGEYLAIGAPQHNATGSVYIYKKNATEWQFHQQLTAPQPQADDRFGTVLINGDYLFVSATGYEADDQPANLDSGSIYVYQLFGTTWTYLQQLMVPESSMFGERMVVDGTTLITNSIGTSMSKIFHSFILQGGIWQFQSSSGEFGSLEENVYDYEAENGHVYLLTHPMPGDRIQIIDYETWTETETFELPSDDQVYTSIALEGNKMFVGSSAYWLQMTRNFPVLYLKKLGGQWQYQQSLYGIGQPNHDDYFGSVLAISGENLVIGARSEGPILPYGKAYYLDTQTLNTASFEHRSAVIFPNPVTDFFMITLPSNQLLQKTEVYSVSGKLLLEAPPGSTRIDIGHFGSGIYFARMQFDDGTVTTTKILRH